MYRVVLVDDEPWALTWIEKIFKWNDQGFEVIAKTLDAEEALDVICREKPDVVFTDIRMPGLSGIDLLKMVRKKGMDTEFIIISGFAEFAYAQQALQEGAFDYRLKPIQMDETEGLLKKLFYHLEAKRSSRSIDFYEALMERHADIQCLLDSIAFKRTNRYFQAVTVYFKNPKNKRESLDFIERIPFFELNMGKRKNVYLINCNASVYPIVNEKYPFLFDEGEVSIGFSSLSEEMESIPRLFKEADIAASKTFVSENSRMCNYSKINVNLLKNILERLKAGIDTKRYESLASIMAEVPGYFEEQNLGVEEAVFLWNQIAAYVAHKYKKVAENQEFEYMNYEQLTDRFENLKSFCSHITKLFFLLNESEESYVNNGEANKNFEELLEYINRNYDRKLYLKELAQKFYINSTYCCDLFQKVTGGTFSEYITSLRMKKARELLEKGEHSIEQICEEVGYADYYYFNTIFKKYHGVTPVKYRKSNR